jgi:hypothetical protein
VLLWQHAGDLPLEKGEVPPSRPDAEIEVTCNCVRRCCTLLLGRLCLGRRRPIFLLLLRCGSLARDESSYPSQRFYVLRRSSKPLRLTSNTPEAVCSTSGTVAPAPVPAEGWAAEAEGLAGSGAGGGVVA